MTAMATSGTDRIAKIGPGGTPTRIDPRSQWGALGPTNAAIVGFVPAHLATEN
jgi:hypothetical protein